ncbi:hypothetical protein [Micromonospora sp. SH-82]|uniref:hypothetical protein n=1 Tax=Micromonospora sp. SH-82 TaxID=3132938 RepID=UPI003EB92BD2
MKYSTLEAWDLLRKHLHPQDVERLSQREQHVRGAVADNRDVQRALEAIEDNLQYRGSLGMQFANLPESNPRQQADRQPPSSPRTLDPYGMEAAVRAQARVSDRVLEDLYREVNKAVAKAESASAPPGHAAPAPHQAANLPAFVPLGGPPGSGQYPLPQQPMPYQPQNPQALMAQLAGFRIGQDPNTAGPQQPGYAPTPQWQGHGYASSSTTPVPQQPGYATTPEWLGQGYSSGNTTPTPEWRGQEGGSGSTTPTPQRPGQPTRPQWQGPGHGGGNTPTR